MSTYVRSVVEVPQKKAQVAAWGASVEREPGLVDQFLIVCGMRDESKFCRADDSDDRR